MNEDDAGSQLPILEADTTPPNPNNVVVPSPNAGWQMPEPKFQQTSGYLPQGYLEKAGFDPSPPMQISPAAAAPAFAPAAPVEAQPDVLDQLAEPPTPVAAPAKAKERSSGARIAMIVLGLLAMIVFIAAFLGVIYYLFLSPQNGGSTF